jgi:hypothetical protein
MAVVSLKNKVYSRSALAGNLSIAAPLVGMSLWLDASDASTFSFSSGTRVSEWRDKSGNAYHFAQATGANQPDRVDTQNGLSAVRMRISTATYYLTNTSSWNWSTSPFTVLAVARFNIGPYTALLGRKVTTALQMGTNAADPNAISISRIGQATASSNLTQATNTTSQITYKSAGISSGTVVVQAYQNKTAASSTITLSSLGTGTENWIGASDTGTIADHFGNNGFLCEMLVYPFQLDNTQRTSVETYLMTKWGL